MKNVREKIDYVLKEYPVVDNAYTISVNKYDINIQIEYNSDYVAELLTRSYDEVKITHSGFIEFKFDTENLGIEIVFT